MSTRLNFEMIVTAVVEGRKDKVEQLVNTALNMGISPEEILNKGLILGMEQVGQKFRRKEYYLPEVLMSGNAMKAGVEILRPALSQKSFKAVATVVLGTVEGDIHDIGKNIVGMMIEGAGFQVVDLGVDVPSRKFIKAVRDNNAQVLGLSALLTTTMPRMKEVIRDLKESGLKDKVKVVIGGAPVTRDYAEEIGADGYGSDGASAVDEVKRLVGSTTTH